MKINSISRLKALLFLPYLIGLFTLMVLFWSTWIQIQQPDSGAHWSYTTGEVDKIEPKSPAASFLEVGDRIIAIDGLPVYAARDFPGRRPGQATSMLVERHSEIKLITFKLASPTLSVLLSRLEAIIISAFFWLLGMLVVSYAQNDKREVLYFLFIQVVVLTLNFGAVSSFGPMWAAWVFRLLLIWVGPMAIYAHLYFPSLVIQYRKSKQIVLILCSLSLLITVLYLGQEIWHFPDQYLGRLIFIWLGLNLFLFIIGILIAYHSTELVELRKKITIVSLAALLSFLPVVVFSILPSALFSQTVLPYNITFLFLIILPMGIGYAIVQHRLIKLEHYINRGAAYALTMFLYGAVYCLTYLLILRYIHSQSQTLSFIELAIVLVLVVTAYPLYMFFLRAISRAFYGGWYDDRTAVQQVSQALYSADRKYRSIGITLCQTLQRTMQLEYVNLLLSDGQILSTDSPYTESQVGQDDGQFNDAVTLLNELHKRLGKEIGRPGEILRIQYIDSKIGTRLLGPKPQLWLMLGGSESPLGLLILGYQRGGKEFEASDLSILEVVVRQAIGAMENAIFLEEIRQRSELIKLLHHQLLQTREEERKRVAYELHDQIIQALVGLNYQLANIRYGTNEKIISELKLAQTDVRQILSDLRQICFGLRTPALDTLGLPQTLQSRIIELEQQVPFRISFTVEGDDEQEIPESVSLCLFKVFQESIQNVKKHADAESVDIKLNISLDEVKLSVQDDGKGFVVPLRLSKLSNEQHFGLIGLQEFVDTVQGIMQIQSAPGQGCCLTVSIPLSIGSNEERVIVDTQYTSPQDVERLVKTL